MTHAVTAYKTLGEQIRLRIIKGLSTSTFPKFPTNKTYSII